MIAVIRFFLTSLQLALLLSIGIIALHMIWWIIRDRIDAPFVPTSQRKLPLIMQALDVGPGDIVYELGSGDGRFVLAGARMAPEAHFIGIEYSPPLHVVASLRKKWRGASNAEFRRVNFFNVEFSNATKIYTYLLPDAMDALLPKFERELHGARLASCAFQFKNKQPVSIIELAKEPGAHGQNRLYIYQF